MLTKAEILVSACPSPHTTHGAVCKCRNPKPSTILRHQKTFLPLNGCEPDGPRHLGGSDVALCSSQPRGVLMNKGETPAKVNDSKSPINHTFSPQ